MLRRARFEAAVHAVVWFLAGALAWAQDAQPARVLREDESGRAGGMTTADYAPLAPGQAVRFTRDGAVRSRLTMTGPPATVGWAPGAVYPGYTPMRIYPDDIVFYNPSSYGRMLGESSRAGQSNARRETLFRGALDMYNERMGNPPASQVDGGGSDPRGPLPYGQPPSWSAYSSGERAGVYEAELWLARDRNLLRTAKAYTEKGSALFRAGSYEGAADAFRLAAASDHGDAAVRLLAGHAYFALGRYDHAMSYIRRAFQLQPKIAMLDYTIHGQYGNAADFEKHLDSLKKSAEARPADAETWALLGYVYRYSGNRAAAVKALTRAYKMQPQDRFVRALLDVEPDAKKGG